MKVYNSQEVAELLQCAEETVQEQAKAGALPGLKFGRGWMFPQGALFQRLDELALEQAEERRKPARPSAVSVRVPDRCRRMPPSLS